MSSGSHEFRNVIGVRITTGIGEDVGIQEEVRLVKKSLIEDLI